MNHLALSLGNFIVLTNKQKVTHHLISQAYTLKQQRLTLRIFKKRTDDRSQNFQERTYLYTVSFSFSPLLYNNSKTSALTLEFKKVLLKQWWDGFWLYFWDDLRVSQGFFQNSYPVLFSKIKPGQRWRAWKNLYIQARFMEAWPGKLQIWTFARSSLQNTVSHNYELGVNISHIKLGQI